MSTPTKNDFRQVYQVASTWPVADRLALVQLLMTNLRLDLKPSEAVAPTTPESGRPPVVSDETVPRGVPVERILARTIPTFLDDAGAEQLRWEYLREKYLK